MKSLKEIQFKIHIFTGVKHIIDDVDKYYNR